MKYRHVFWAFILIGIGVLFMLNNFGVIEFGMRAFWNLWPLILVLWGISILPVKEWIKIAGLAVVLIFTIAFFDRLTSRSPWFFFHNHEFVDGNWKLDDDDEEDNFENTKDQTLTVPFDSLSRKGVLKLVAAAGNFNIQGVTSDLLTFNKTGNIGNYSLTTSDSGGVKTINLNMERSHIRHSDVNNKVDITLNETPFWNLDFDIGAAEINLDLRDYCIDTTIFNAGASSIDVKIGEKNPKTVMTFNAGASSIKVSIPKASGVEVKSESFLVSKDYEGMEKKGDGLYQTPNFNASKNKVYLRVKTAVSKIEIVRY
jgi:hypothetical protein